MSRIRTIPPEGAAEAPTPVLPWAPKENGVAVDVLCETIIQRPIGVVAAFAANPSNAPRWYVNIESVE